MTLYEWAYLALLTFAPPEKIPQFPGHEETIAETKARYSEVALAIVDTAMRTDSSLSDKQEVAFLVAQAIGETGMARDADVGPCYRGKGLEKRCDSGRAASLFQVHRFHHEGRIPTTKEIFEDRRLAAAMVLRVATHSLRLCSKLAPEDHLSGLTGRCQAGVKSVRARWRFWKRLEGWAPAPKKAKPKPSQQAAPSSIARAN